MRLKNIFTTESDQRFTNKSFLLKIDDYITLDNQKHTSTSIFFRLNMIRNLNDLNIDLEIHSWSNDGQKYVSLADSIWMENEFGNGKYIDTIEKQFELIINNFLKVISYFKEEYEVKEFIHRLENQKYNFHYQLLNLFSQDILEKMVNNCFDNYPILNIGLLKSDINKDSIRYLILPRYADGFYYDNITVNVGSCNGNCPTIYDNVNGCEITKDEFLERTGLDE